MQGGSHSFLQYNATFPALALSSCSIYKMFPADKKRVESALASAHLPKGKVGKYKPRWNVQEKARCPHIEREREKNKRVGVCVCVCVFQYDTMKPDVFTEAAFKVFLANLCPRPEILEIFTS